MEGTSLGMYEAIKEWSLSVIPFSFPYADVTLWIGLVIELEDLSLAKELLKPMLFDVLAFNS